MDDKTLVEVLFRQYHFDIVVNLAAQASVRYSIDYPNVYMESNIIGVYNIPSAVLRSFKVYGSTGRPEMANFGFTDKLRQGETIRIFNYGNCLWDFTYVDDIIQGVVRVTVQTLEKQQSEDGLLLLPYKIYNISNDQPENLLEFVDILQHEPIDTGVLPEDYNFEAHKELVPMQPADVSVTYADVSNLERNFGFCPSSSLREGLRLFVRWYKQYYQH